MFGNFTFGAGYFAQVMRALVGVPPTPTPTHVPSGPPVSRRLVKIGGALVRVEVEAFGAGLVIRQPAAAFAGVAIEAFGVGRRLLEPSAEPEARRRAIRRSRRR